MTRNQNMLPQYVVEGEGFLTEIDHICGIFNTQEPPCMYPFTLKSMIFHRKIRMFLIAKTWRKVQEVVHKLHDSFKTPNPPLSSCVNVLLPNPSPSTPILVTIIYVWTIEIMIKFYCIPQSYYMAIIGLEAICYVRWIAYLSPQLVAPCIAMKSITTLNQSVLQQLVCSNICCHIL